MIAALHVSKDGTTEIPKDDDDFGLVNLRHNHPKTSRSVAFTISRDVNYFWVNTLSARYDTPSLIPRLRGYLDCRLNGMQTYRWLSGFKIHVFDSYRVKRHGLLRADIEFTCSETGLTVTKAFFASTGRLLNSVAAHAIARGYTVIEFSRDYELDRHFVHLNLIGEL
ncbi:hypothetical protein Peetri_00042 [Pseudomonas phage vB_PpuM-Peetri]